MRESNESRRNAPAGVSPPVAGELTVGAVVRSRRWGGRYAGTVVRREAGSVFVAWHGTFVEDQLDPDDVTLWADAPAELRTWRGGIGRLDADGTVTVEPLEVR